MDPDRPAVDVTLGRPAMARTLAWFYAAGATLGGLSLLVPHSGTTDLVGIVAVMGIAYAGGGVLLAGADRLPEAAIPAFLTLGSLLISAAVYFDGNTSSVYSFLYVWVGVEAFYFLRPRLAALQVALAGAGYAWALSMVHS